MFMNVMCQIESVLFVIDEDVMQRKKFYRGFLYFMLRPLFKIIHRLINICYERIPNMLQRRQGCSVVCLVMTYQWAIK